MRDPGVMRPIEPASDLNRERQRLLDRQHGRPIETLLQRLAFEVLEHEIVGVAVAADVVDRADVGVVERRDRAGFLLEARPRLVVLGETGRHDLDGDGPIESRVARAIHLAHRAGARPGDDLVAAQTLTGLEGHAAVF